MPTDGADVRLITMDLGFSEMPDAAWLREAFPSVRIAYRCNNRHVRAVACASGAGLAVLHSPLGDSYPGLQTVEVAPAPPGRDVWLGYHRDLRRLPRLRALVEMLMQALSPAQSDAGDQGG